MYGGQQGQFQKVRPFPYDHEGGITPKLPICHMLLKRTFPALLQGMGGGDARGGAYDPAMAAASMAAHQAAYGAVPQAPEQAKKPVIRVGAGETWLDPTLSEWPDSK